MKIIEAVIKRGNFDFNFSFFLPIGVYEYDEVKERKKKDFSVETKLTVLSISRCSR